MPWERVPFLRHFSIIDGINLLEEAGGIFVNFRAYKQNINKLLSGYLDLPRDVVLDLPKITLIGDTQLYIENHKGVIEYNGEKIKLNVSIGQLEIVGEGLVIRAINSDEIYLDGSIKTINFLK